MAFEGGNTVTVWEGFSLYYRNPLYHDDGDLIGKIMVPLVPSLQQIGQWGHNLQDNNARRDRARVVNTYLLQASVNWILFLVLEIYLFCMNGP